MKQVDESLGNDAIAFEDRHSLSPAAGHRITPQVNQTSSKLEMHVVGSRSVANGQIDQDDNLYRCSPPRERPSTTAAAAIPNSRVNPLELRIALASGTLVSVGSPPGSVAEASDRMRTYISPVESDVI